MTSPAQEATALLDQARRHFDESIAAQVAVREDGVATIVEAAGVIATAFAAGHKLLLCGNGGSAADCQHMAAEFVSRLSAARERRALPAIALTTDTSFLTAHANDYSFDRVFARQIEALGTPGDVLVAISTSGRSANIVEAVHAARTARVHVIGLFGSGASLEGSVDTCLLVPGVTTQAIQECFLACEHAICELVDEILFADETQSTGVAAGTR